MYRECTSDVQIRRCRFQSANTLECQRYFGSSPNHFFFILHCTLKRNTNPGYLRNKLFYCLYLILEMAQKLCLFYSNFFFRVAIFAQPFVLKLNYANCRSLTSTAFYSVYARDNKFIFCALRRFCYLQWQDRVPSQQLQVARAEVVVDLQNVQP